MQKAIPVMIMLYSLLGRRWSIIVRILRMEIVENDSIVIISLSYVRGR